MKKSLIFLAIAICGCFHAKAQTSTVVGWGGGYGYGPYTVPADLTNAVAIGAGGVHGLAVRSEGTVVAWGYNAYGQTTVPAGLSGVVAVAGGYNHSLALKGDGTVVAWGQNTYGETSVPEGLTGVVAIATHHRHNLALKSDGTVVAWGNNEYGQGTVPSGLTGVVAVSAGSYHSVALKSDGTVVAWGYNAQGQTTVPSGLSDVVAISAGGDHNLALKRDGTVVAWGYNGNGQATVPSGLTGVTDISAAGLYSIALKSDGTLVAWGDNYFNQVSGASGRTNVKEIAAGGVYNVAIVRPTVGSTGTNFWIAFPHSEASYNEMSIFLSSSVSSSGTVSGPGFSTAFTATPGDVTQVSIPGSAMLAAYDAVENKGIHITASQPVSAYCYVYSDGASFAFAGLPMPMLGTNYYVMARASMIYDVHTNYFIPPIILGYTTNYNHRSELAVVAAESNTTVTITPFAYGVLSGHAGTEPFTVVLNQGETYQLKATNFDGDVTGTRVSSDKPVAVFGGANAALIPHEWYYAGNPLVQQQLPVEAWGTGAVGLPYALRPNGTFYRVLAANSNTVVTLNGVETFTIANAGGFFEITNQGPVDFQSSKPIQVAQFAPGSMYDYDY